MVIYSTFAEAHKGLNFNRFAKMFELLQNNQNPLIKEIFNLYDTDRDGVIWFEDLIRGLDV